MATLGRNHAFYMEDFGTERLLHWPEYWLSKGGTNDCSQFYGMASWEEGIGCVIDWVIVARFEVLRSTMYVYFKNKATSRRTFHNFKNTSKRNVLEYTKNRKGTDSARMNERQSVTNGRR